MISVDDIEAFEEETKEPRAAADEFVRRARKGIPSDRWGSSRDLHLVAQGIAAYRQIIGMYVFLVEDLMDEARKRGEDAMRLHTADSKYAKAEQ